MKEILYNNYDINYFITDHLGSTRAIVNTNGEITAQYNYYPFGKQWEDASLMANTNRWGFSGKEKQTIKDLGWLDFSARMYADCEMPIFTTSDPLSEKYPWISPYAYCANNPLRYVDPNGMSIHLIRSIGLLDHWVINYETDEYEWMDNVTAPENTPEGYKYVGANGNAILSDMGVTTNYDEQYKKGTGFGIDGDENIPLGAALIVSTGHTKGNISISANVSSNLENATENNHTGKKFEGIAVTGRLTQPDHQNQESGNLFVSYGDKQYSSYLKYLASGSSNIMQAGTTLKTATVYIPATEISSSKVLSSASIKAAATSNTLLWQVPYTEFQWNLQTGISFRPLK